MYVIAAFSLSVSTVKKQKIYASTWRTIFKPRYNFFRDHGGYLPLETPSLGQFQSTAFRQPRLYPLRLTPIMALAGILLNRNSACAPTTYVTIVNDPDIDVDSPFLAACRRPQETPSGPQRSLVHELARRPLSRCRGIETTVEAAKIRTFVRSGHSR
jgi:hypothetical protein